MTLLRIPWFDGCPECDGEVIVGSTDRNGDVFDDDPWACENGHTGHVTVEEGDDGEPEGWLTHVPTEVTP